MEPGTAEALLAFLDSMRFMLRVEVSLADDLVVRWHPDDVDGPATRTGFGSFALVPTTSRYDGELAGVQALEALRVAALRPRLGLDTDHRTLPHEVGWLTSAVHLDKGCYRGQESVARVHNLGPSAAPAGPAAPGRQRLGAAGHAVRRCSWAAGTSAGWAAWRGTTSWGRSGWRS